MGFRGKLRFFEILGIAGRQLSTHGVVICIWSHMFHLNGSQGGSD